MTALQLIVIYTADLERTRAFFTALGLKFQLEQHGRGPEHYAAILGDVVLEIYPASESSGVTNSLRLGLAIYKLDDIVEQLTATGAKMISPPDNTPRGRRAVFCDWEGRRVELIEKVEREGRCC